LFKHLFFDIFLLDILFFERVSAAKGSITWQFLLPNLKIMVKKQPGCLFSHFNFREDREWVFFNLFGRNAAILIQE